MAYGVKYQTTFYNFFGKAVTVSLLKDTYVGAISPIKLVKCVVENNYKDDTTPVITLGASISIVNDGTFDQYNDLLSGYEKDIFLRITWNSIIVFEGFVSFDLNEQQLLPYAVITLKASNYLKRLENEYLPLLSTNYTLSNALEIVVDSLQLTGLNYPVYINATILEDSMTEAAGTYSFLSMMKLGNSLFYTTDTDYLNVVDTLNSLLFPFGCFLYTYGTKWMIERYADITKTNTPSLPWIYAPANSLVEQEVTTLQQRIHKQDGDFEYINSSQISTYNSGVQKMKISLNAKKWESVVFSSYTTGMPACTVLGAIRPLNFPLAAALTENLTWYKHPDVVSVVSTGASYAGIKNYVQWYQYGYTRVGLFFKVKVTIPIHGDAYEDRKLNISFSNYSTASNFDVCRISSNFMIRVGSGTHINKYLRLTTDNLIRLSVDTTSEYIFKTALTPNTSYGEQIYKTELSYSGISTALGSLSADTEIDLIFGFLPMQFQLTVNEAYQPDDIMDTNVLGDLKVTLSCDQEDNLIENTINENFLKTEELQVNIMDLATLNYINGPYLLNGTKTNSWVTLQNTADTLINHFIKDRYGVLCKTYSELHAEILCDSFLKTFCIITDDTLVRDSETIDYILLSYVWDLISGTYEIVAREHTPEQITLSE